MIYKLDIFSRAKLIQNQNGYTLVLYIEKQTSELGEEFLSSLSSKSKKLQDDSLDYIKKYINDNYRDIKIDTVKIMLGSILVASIGYSSLGAAVTSAKPAINRAQLQTNVIYTVKPGDTLYNIAKKTGTTVELLKKLNKLSSNIIYPGQKLKLAPVSTPATPTTPVAPATPATPATPTTPTTPVVPATGNLILVNKKHALPGSYIPSNLVNPNVPSVNSSKTKMAPEAAKALEALFLKAKQDNIKLTAVSGYRSYTRQNEIFASNIKKYGSVAAANQFSAKPGQSEHQTGLAMDISSPSVNFTLTQSYAQTREGKWLKENAPQFGFILRYPKGKENITGYQFEPWHIRYVGKSAALEIAGRNITLEEYLGKI